MSGPGEKIVPRRKQASTGRFVEMEIPPSYRQRPLHPFTQKVVGMPVNSKRALVFEFAPGESTDWRKAICCCATAVGTAKRKDAKKAFTMRGITVNGARTCAVWRIK